jgi:redox-sensitive bicupin YhaK (pirin superfamily)
VTRWSRLSSPQPEVSDGSHQSAVASRLILSGKALVVAAAEAQGARLLLVQGRQL